MNAVKAQTGVIKTAITMWAHTHAPAMLVIV